MLGPDDLFLATLKHSVLCGGVTFSIGWRRLVHFRHSRVDRNLEPRLFCSLDNPKSKLTVGKH
jgi:hypothetical protein